MNLTKEVSAHEKKRRNAFAMHGTSSANCAQATPLGQSATSYGASSVSKTLDGLSRRVALTHNGEIVARTRMQPHFFR